MKKILMAAAMALATFTATAANEFTSVSYNNMDWDSGKPNNCLGSAHVSNAIIYTVKVNF